VAQSDPGSLERTIPKTEVKPRAEERPVATPRLPSVPGQRFAGSFVLGAVNIQGATVFSPSELAQSFEPYLASQVGQAELDRIAADITDRYRRAGYLLSYATLPEQHVQSGIVQIRVVEGFIGRVRVERGGASAAAVRAIAQKLRAERPLRTATLERVLGLARDIPGVVVTDTRISRSSLDPARHEITIVLRSDSIRALTYLDNRGTVDGARLRGYSSFSIAPVGIPGSQVQLDLFTIPSDDFRFVYGQAKASLPLGWDGLRLSASISRGDQFRRLDGPNQHGDSQQAIAALAYPLAKSRAFSLVGNVSLGDWKSKERRAGTTIQRDRFQVARAWLEVTRVATTRIDGRIGISQGLDLDSATDAGDPLASRPGAGHRFTIFNADMQFTAPVTERLLVRLDTMAQYSTRPLLTSEEFALGGSRIGRSFDFNEVTGDHGVGAMLELRYRLPDVPKGPKAFDLFVFLDGGGAFRKRSSPELPEKQWLAGAGTGVRLSIFGLRWSAEVGVPIARTDAHRGVRAFFSIVKVL
jgi:hemolysin activation/secretion protein